MFLGMHARKAGLCIRQSRQTEPSSLQGVSSGSPSDVRQTLNSLQVGGPLGSCSKAPAHPLSIHSLKLKPCAAQPAASPGLFPAGKQQARVELPALMLHVEAAAVTKDDVLSGDINKAISGGANSVVLWEGGAGAAALYDAALKLKEVLRGRANLLLVDRTDIAIAAGAEGVLLTDQGVLGDGLGFHLLA